MHFRFGGPHVVAFDAQGTDDSNGEPCLFEDLTHDRCLRRLVHLYRAGRHLNSGHFERHIVVREHEQPPLMHDVADDLPDDSTHWSAAHAAFNGVIAAICSDTRS